jgi:hypothetical protein
VDEVTVTPLSAALIGVLLTGLVWMLASLLSAGERSQADIWREQWAAASDAVRQLTLDTAKARRERDRARATAVVLEQQLAQIVRLADDGFLIVDDTIVDASDILDDEDDEGVGLR